tara:strand:+ start:27160 stop:27525 length:366 start_codon:yes stop_codon:yes gene_type:complete
LKKPKGKQEDSFAFTVEGRPVPKGRPRMSRKGRVYTPEATKEAEQQYVDSVSDAPTFEGSVYVELTFSKESTDIVITSKEDWKSPLRGDLDNYIKLALDGIQKAGIIANDKQVVGVHAVKI